MRFAGVLVALALLATACTGGARHPRAGSGPAPGCGVVPRRLVVGLVGDKVDVTVHGTLAALREHRRPISCTTRAPAHRERYVSVRADYHPAPLKLPSRSCRAGWVYAGTPDKYAPACQDAVGGRGRTQLVVRWQPYVVHVSVGRSDRSWAGDPEVALEMSRDLARRLGVREARGDG